MVVIVYDLDEDSLTFRYIQHEETGSKEKSGLRINSPLFSIVPNQLSPLRHRSLRGCFAFCSAASRVDRSIDTFHWRKNRTLLVDYKILEFALLAKETPRMGILLTKKGRKKIKENVDTETDFIGHPLRERSIECTLSNRTRNEVFINPYSIVNATHSLSLSFLILILSSRYRFHERANYEQANPRKIRHGNYKRIG